MKKKIRAFLMLAACVCAVTVSCVCVLWLAARPAGEPGNIADFLPLMCVVLTFLLALCVAAAERFSEKLMRPHREMLEAIEQASRDPEARPEEYHKIAVIYEELEPVAAYFRRLLAELSAAAAQSTAKTADIEALLAAMDDGFVMLDSGFRILLINRRGQDLLGVPDNAHRRNITHFYRTEAFHDALLGVMLGEKRVVTDLPIGRGTGRFFISSAGERGITVIISDVTELIRLETVRSEFAANASHELKTPLTSVSGFAELLSSGIITDEKVAREYAGKILEETQRLSALVDDLLRLSTLESRRELKSESVNLKEMFEYAAQLLAGPLEQKRVTWEIRGEATVEVPREPLFEIALNLFDNAVKYNHDGGRVTVDVSNSGFAVADTGIGIPPEHLERIFERFYRVDKARSRKTGGTGLGLSIVKHAAESIGAAVNVKSTQAGSVFTVNLIENGE